MHFFIHAISSVYPNDPIIPYSYLIVSGVENRTLRNPSEGGWTPYVEQQKSYHFYTTEILFQTEKEVSKIKLVYASIADHLLHSSYPYPLDQRELVDQNDNF